MRIPAHSFVPISGNLPETSQNVAKTPIKTIKRTHFKWSKKAEEILRREMEKGTSDRAIIPILNKEFNRKFTLYSVRAKTREIEQSLLLPKNKRGFDITTLTPNDFQPPPLT